MTGFLYRCRSCRWGDTCDRSWNGCYGSSWEGSSAGTIPTASGRHSYPDSSDSFCYHDPDTGYKRGRIARKPWWRCCQSDWKEERIFGEFMMFSDEKGEDTWCVLCVLLTSRNRFPRSCFRAWRIQVYRWHTAHYVDQHMTDSWSDSAHTHVRPCPRRSNPQGTPAHMCYLMDTDTKLQF